MIAASLLLQEGGGSRFLSNSDAQMQELQHHKIIYKNHPEDGETFQVSGERNFALATGLNVTTENSLQPFKIRGLRRLLTAQRCSTD